MISRCLCAVLLWSAGVSLLWFWCDQQLSVCYPCAISRFSLWVLMWSAVICGLSLCDQQVSLCHFWYDQQVPVLSLCDQEVPLCHFYMISRCLCYHCVIRRCLFVTFYMISRCLCAIIVWSGGASLSLLYDQQVSVLSLCDQEVPLCDFWYDQQVSVCYPRLISKCFCGFWCDRQVCVQYPPVISMCLFVAFYLISMCLFVAFYLIRRCLFVAFVIINICLCDTTCDHQVSLFVVIDVISSYLCAILVLASGVSLWLLIRLSGIYILSSCDQQMSLCC